MLSLLLFTMLVGSPSPLLSYTNASEINFQDTKAKDGKGLSVDEVTFIEAARQGDNATVAKFLAAGLDANLIDKRDDERSTILMVAAMAGKTDTVKVLLDHGAAINVKTKKGRTALTWASWRGMTDTVQALLAAGADINTRDDWGSTPLTFAVSRNRTQTVAVLLNAAPRRISITLKRVKRH